MLNHTETKGDKMSPRKSRKQRKQYALSLGKKNSQIGTNLSFAAAEAYKMLRTNLMFSLPDEDNCKIIGVTSALRGEGKSVTAANLAYVIAQTGKRVLLIEADMRLGCTAASLGLSTSPGLSNLLAGMCSSSEAIQSTETLGDAMIIASGDVPPNPAELLGSDQMKKLLGSLSSDFDFIVLDLPPAIAVSDASVVSELVHGMIVVVRQDYCDTDSLNETMRQLEFLDTKLLGFVMTNASRDNRRYYKYGKYRKKNYYDYNSAY